MLLVKSDFDRLEEHAKMCLDDDEEVGVIWRCLHTKATILFVSVDMEVDYGIEVKSVTIDRPYCPDCNPQAKAKPDIFLPSLIEPLPYQYLISIPRHPNLKPI